MLRALDYLAPVVLLTYALMLATLNGLNVLAVRSGLNLRLADPNISLQQIGLATAAGAKSLTAPSGAPTQPCTRLNRAGASAAWRHLPPR